MSSTPVRRSSRAKKAPTPFTPGAGDFARGVPSGLLTSTSPEMADAASTATHKATPPLPAATPAATGGGRARGKRMWETRRDRLEIYWGSPAQVRVL